MAEASASRFASARPSSGQTAKGEQCLDLCLLMDCTGSMSSYLNECKNLSSYVIEKLKIKFPNQNFRVAFVGYRDFGDAQRFVVVPPLSNYYSNDDYKSLLIFSVF